jgi:hypothetical protein
MRNGWDFKHTRRDWLRLAGLGAFGLTLPGLLRAGASSRREPPARSCVLFLLHGGPSQLDTWDMKPDAPDNVRGAFKPVDTNVPGVRVCEHLPLLARRAHLYTVVRSMTHTAINHNTATYTVTTGHPPLRDVITFVPTENDFPHLGAQVALGRPARRTVPAAVSLPDPVSDGPYTTPGQNGGFLGAGYAPFRVVGDPSEPDFRVDGLAEPPERLADRETLRKQLDGARGPSKSSPAVEGLERSRERAVALLTSDEARRAFDLGREPTRLRERYGRHKYGQSLLLARRLVEAGVRLVTVYWGGKVNNPDPHWDTHFNNDRRLKEELLPPFDQCFSAFLDDLHARGLLATTLVLAMGEFGRTPRFGQFTGNGVNETGRDHWAACYSILVAGGKAGSRVLGKSDRIAAYPADDPYAPEDVQATVLDALGVDPASPVRDAFGRDVPLSTGKVRKTLFGFDG